MPVHRYVTRMNVFRFLIADLGSVDMKPGWPAQRDSPVSKISPCYCFPNNNYHAFILDKRLARSRLPG